jgi:hypothetical protein
VGEGVEAGVAVEDADEEDEAAIMAVVVEEEEEMEEVNVDVELKVFF